MPQSCPVIIGKKILSSTDPTGSCDHGISYQPPQQNVSEVGIEAWHSGRITSCWQQNSGESDGAMDGVFDEAIVGLLDVSALGLLDEAIVGLLDVSILGLLDAATVGLLDVSILGLLDAATVGLLDVSILGLLDAATVGLLD
eukprot:scaffold22874_cov225-Cylindrotheca_fusiformis.AAC.1